MQMDFGVEIGKKSIEGDLKRFFYGCERKIFGIYLMRHDMKRLKVNLFMTCAFINL